MLLTTALKASSRQLSSSVGYGDGLAGCRFVWVEISGLTARKYSGLCTDLKICRNFIYSVNINQKLMQITFRVNIPTLGTSVKTIKFFIYFRKTIYYLSFREGEKNGIFQTSTVTLSKKKYKKRGKRWVYMFYSFLIYISIIIVAYN